MTATLNRYLVVGCALIVLACSAGCERSSSGSPTTSCEVRQHPEQFDGKAIVVRADIQGDWERIVLSSPSCPKLGISITYSKDALQNGDAEKLNAAAQDQLLGKPKRPTRVTVGGTFVAPKAPGDSATLIVDRLLETKNGQPTSAK